MFQLFGIFNNNNQNAKKLQIQIEPRNFFFFLAFQKKLRISKQINQTNLIINVRNKEKKI
mgnify:CR=1 FL=1